MNPANKPAAGLCEHLMRLKGDRKFWVKLPRRYNGPFKAVYVAKPKK